MRKTNRKDAENLRAWLDKHGPATKEEIRLALGFGRVKLAAILKSQPEWLVSPGVRTPEGNRNARETLYHSQGQHNLGFCRTCLGKNFHPSYREKEICFSCDIGKPAVHKAKDEFFEDEELEHIDPREPCKDYPGSIEKVKTLAKRYACGVPLWNDRDKIPSDIDSKWVGPPEELWG